MIVGELFQRLGLKVDPSGFKSANSGLDKIKGALRGLAAGFIGFKTVTGLAGITKEIAALGDSIDKTAGKLGIGTKALQELRFAGELGGVSTGSLDKSLEIIGKRASEAALGLETAQRSFRDLGIDVRGANGELKPTDVLLEEVTANFSKAGSSADELRIASDLFGRAGPKLINVLKGGSAGLAAMRKEASELGSVLSQDVIDQSVEFTDNQTRLGRAMRGVKTTIAGAFLPTILKTQRAVIGWFKANQKLIAQKLGRIFGALARALANVSRALLRVGEAIVKRLGPAKTALLGLAAVVGLLVFLFGLKAVAIGIVAGLLFLLIDEFETLGKGGETQIGKLITGWSALIEKLREPISEDDNVLVRIGKTIVGVWDDINAAIAQGIEGVVDWIEDFQGAIQSAETLLRKIGLLDASVEVRARQRAQAPNPVLAATLTKLRAQKPEQKVTQSNTTNIVNNIGSGADAGAVQRGTSGALREGAREYRKAFQATTPEAAPAGG